MMMVVLLLLMEVMVGDVRQGQRVGPEEWLIVRSGSGCSETE